LPERQCASWQLALHRKKLALLSLSFFLIISACGGGNKQGLQLQEVSASALDPFVEDLNRNDPNLLLEMRSPRTVHHGHSPANYPMAFYRASMFNANRQTANPILVRFDGTGEVDSIQRLLVIIGTVDDVKNKSLEPNDDDQTLEKIFESVKAKKLDMRKAEDRLALIQEVTQPYGADKAALFGVRIYDDGWTLRYRWPAENSKQ